MLDVPIGGDHKIELCRSSREQFAVLQTRPPHLAHVANTVTRYLRSQVDR